MIQQIACWRDNAFKCTRSSCISRDLPVTEMSLNCFVSFSSTVLSCTSKVILLTSRNIRNHFVWCCYFAHPICYCHWFSVDFRGCFFLCGLADQNHKGRPIPLLQLLHLRQGVFGLDVIVSKSILSRPVKGFCIADFWPEISKTGIQNALPMGREANQSSCSAFPLFWIWFSIWQVDLPHKTGSCLDLVCKHLFNWALPSGGITVCFALLHLCVQLVHRQSIVHFQHVLLARHALLTHAHLHARWNRFMKENNLFGTIRYVYNKHIYFPQIPQVTKEVRISSYIILYHPKSSYIILYHPISSYLILYLSIWFP